LLAGREHSLVFRHEKEVFLSFATRAGGPPIIDLQFGKDTMESSLRTSSNNSGPVQTYYRINGNLNHECTTASLPSFLGGSKSSYLWYKQDWSMRLTWEEASVRARNKAISTRHCMETEALLETPPRLGKSSWYSKCTLCANHCRTVKQNRIECRDDAAMGRMVSHQDLGLIMVGDKFVPKRREIEWVGDIAYTADTGCEAVGLGELSVVSQVQGAEGWKEKQFLPSSRSTPAEFLHGFYSTDFTYAGAVKEFSDEMLFQYHRGRQLLKSPHQIMCEQWQRQLDEVRKGAQAPNRTSPWVHLWSEEDQRGYYFHTETNATMWSWNSNVESDLEESILAAHCIGKPDEEPDPADAVHHGWLLLKAPQFEHVQRFYFTLHSCLGAQAHSTGVFGCRLDGYRAPPFVEKKGLGNCSTLARLDKCSSIQSEEQCGKFCTKHGWGEYNCAWQDGQCASGKKMLNPKMYTCTDTCGADSSYIERPRISFRLSRVKQPMSLVPVDGLVTNAIPSPYFGIDIEIGENHYYLGAEETQRDPGCIRCLTTDGKSEPTKKWCFNKTLSWPDVLEDEKSTGACQNTGLSCGPLRDKVKMSPDNCIIDSISTAKKAMMWQVLILEEIAQINMGLYTRPVPHGYGHLKHRVDEVAPARVTNELGRFNRGMQVGLGTRRDAVRGDLEVGFYAMGTLQFGEVRIEDEALAPSQRLSVFKACKPFCTYRGYLADMSMEDKRVWPEGLPYPVLLGVLFDSHSRTIYWGQFGLWYPQGQGEWVDRRKGVVFRGVLKKEYLKFNGDEQSASQKDLHYAPILAGVLSRLKTTPVTDGEVHTPLHKNDMPDAVMESAQLLFGVPAFSEDFRIVCRSRAVSNYDTFMKKYIAVSEAWLAMSEFTQYQYEGRLGITGTGAQTDIDLGIVDAEDLVQTHELRMLGLRQHIEQMTSLNVEAANEIAQGAIELLGKAMAMGKTFDVTDRYWRTLAAQEKTSLHVQRVAARFQALGPTVYLRFQSIEDITSAINDLLSYSADMYCSLCTKAPFWDNQQASTEDDSRSPTKVGGASSCAAWNLGSFDDEQSSKPDIIRTDSEQISNTSEVSRAPARSGASRSRSTLQVTVLRGRNLAVPGGFLTGNHARLRVQVEDAQEDTYAADVAGEDPVWKHGATLTFDGGLKGLDPHTMVRISVYTKASLIEKSFIGSFQIKIIQILRQLSGKHWYKLGWWSPVGSPSVTGEFGELQIAFKLTGLADLLAQYPSYLPPSCGMESAVSSLIERVEERMPRVWAHLLIQEERHSCAWRSVQSNTFVAGSHCAIPSANEVKLKQEQGKTVSQLEESLRDDILDGVFTHDGNSIALFRDPPKENRSFYEGPEYFTATVKAMSKIP